VWYEAPNATGIAYALYNAIQPAARLGRPEGCIPEAVRVDRGREYVSDKFTQVVRALGITMETCRPHRPDDKAVIERAFGSIMTGLSGQRGFTKAPGAHLNTLSKVKPGAVLAFHELLAWLDTHITRYNRTVHSTTEERPVDRWTHTTGWSIPDEDDLVFRLLWSNETRVITSKGITYRGHDYTGDLTHPDGRRNFELIGVKVRLYFIPVCLANDETQSAQTAEVLLGVLRSNVNGLARVDLESQYHAPRKVLTDTLTSFKKLANPATRLTQLAAPVLQPALTAPVSSLALTSGAVATETSSDVPDVLTGTVQDPDSTVIDDTEDIESLEAAYLASTRARLGLS
jgi:putative transposase